MGNSKTKRTAEGLPDVIAPDELARHLHDVVVADCRFDLADPDAGRRRYEVSRIPGAQYFDLDKDLSRPASGRGGRHPLPPLDEFVATLAARGVGDGVDVVCYDDGGGVAARLWWMLRYVGHHRVGLLDGGFPAWTAAGLPVETGPPAPPVRPSRPLTVRRRADMAADAADVRRIVAGGPGLVVDSRAPERYRGEVEPLDPVAGRIPGAVNYPWQGSVDRSGKLLSPEKLAARFADVTDRVRGGSVVVHCGSGVTGCVNVLALNRAGVEDVKLYVGGWSDWCADGDNPVASGP